MNVLLAVWLAWAQAQAETPSPPDIPRYMEVNARLGTGGQPQPGALHQLKERGYTAVICLRTADEGVDLAAEERLLRELGLRYFNIPVASADPKEPQVLEFLALLEQLANDKVFVHCAAANRVGGFLMAQWVLREGMAPDQAEELANRVGLQSEKMRQFARTFVERRKPR